MVFIASEICGIFQNMQSPYFQHGFAVVFPDEFIDTAISYFRGGPCPRRAGPSFGGRGAVITLARWKMPHEWRFLARNITGFYMVHFPCSCHGADDTKEGTTDFGLIEWCQKFHFVEMDMDNPTIIYCICIVQYPWCKKSGKVLLLILLYGYMFHIWLNSI